MEEVPTMSTLRWASAHCWTEGVISKTLQQKYELSYTGLDVRNSKRKLGNGVHWLGCKKTKNANLGKEYTGLDARNKFGKGVQWLGCKEQKTQGWKKSTLSWIQETENASLEREYLVCCSPQYDSMRHSAKQKRNTLPFLIYILAIECRVNLV